MTTVTGKTLLEEILNGEHVSQELVLENQDCPGYVIDTTPDLQVAEIIPLSLYLGSQDVTQDVDILRMLGITHILSIGVPAQALSQLPEMSYCFLPALDLPDEDIDPLLQRALPVIDEAISRGGCIFVHCNAGISRAPTVVVAFLMAFKGFSFCDAMSLVNQKRPSSRPNPGFVKQLIALESKITRDKMSE